jgi:hypothetical protein
MPGVPIIRPLTAVTPDPPDEDAIWNENADPVTKCGQCQVSFLHSSIGLGDPPKWWVCPSCRSRLLGDASNTNSR